jgi:hypothetical protein
VSLDTKADPMNASRTFPPAGGFVVPDAFPVFTMPRAWTAPCLSLAAVGTLARIQAAGTGAFDLADFAGDQAEAIAAELAGAGILVDGVLVDPDAAHRKAALAALVAASPVKPHTPDPGLVYYVLRADGAVKIGHTRSKIKARLRGLVRTYGPLEVLATEAGPPAAETARHEQFAQLRMPDQGGGGGTEFFHAGPALVRHIEGLRAAVAVAA